jgi:DNA repair photolyase
MFPFITQTWNPLAGECLHKCSYCWARALEERYPRLKEKYCGNPRIIQKELKRINSFKETDFIFVCDMTDLFGHWVPYELIQEILNCISTSPAKFLLLTKNPARYKFFFIPQNCVCGATIESDIDHELTGPPERERMLAMANLKHGRKMVSVEPVMDFTPDFPTDLLYMGLEFVAIGYDNYSNGLDEPELQDVEAMIHSFENRGIKVYRKTLREKHDSQDCESEHQNESYRNG